jgi:hypothetical protein
MTKHKTWTFVSKPITYRIVQLSVCFSWHPKSEKTKLYGWGVTVNLFRWYFDLQYRNENPNEMET